jgi:hypothetical protein
VYLTVGEIVHALEILVLDSLDGYESKRVVVEHAVVVHQARVIKTA